jgi:hypothetical protein
VEQCEVARRVVISQSSVRRTANQNKFPPYHITLIQVLKEADFSQRLNYCRFVWQQIILDDNFLENVLFRDEACFSNNVNIIVIIMPKITLAGFARDTSRRLILQTFGVKYWGIKL